MIERAVKCEFCGLGYIEGLKEDEREHKKYHERFETATKIFPELLSYKDDHNEQKIWRHFNDEQLSYAEREYEFRKYMTTKYTRSVRASGFNPEHPSFNDYIAMRLKGMSLGKGGPIHPGDFCDYLISRYGIKDGIEPGYSVWEQNV